MKTTIKRTLVTTLMVGALSITGLLTTQQAAAASTIHVAQSGVDSSSCGDAASPCETLQQAVTNAANGDTISMAAGSYDGNVTINKSLTILGAQTGNDARTRTGAETIINVPAGAPRGLYVNTSDVTIDGVTVDGTDGDNPVGVMVTGPSSNFHLVNSVVKNNKVGLDLLSADRSGLVVSKNLFDSNSTSGSADGIYIAGGTGGNIAIKDNTFRNTDDGTAGSTNAILISGGTETIDGVTISGNSSSNDGSFVYLINASNVTISDNTSDNQVGHGVLVGESVSHLTISKNTFKNGASGVRFGASTTPTSDVTITGNTISGMNSAGISVAADSISDAPTVKDNSITNNAIGLDNDSTVAVLANNNWWGCAAGPGNAGCDSIDGPATANVWYTNAAMTAVNTDADTDPSDDPSAGDTNSSKDSLADTGDNITTLIAGASLMIVAALGAFAILRRHTAKS